MGMTVALLCECTQYCWSVHLKMDLNPLGRDCIYFSLYVQHYLALNNRKGKHLANNWVTSVNLENPATRIVSSATNLQVCIERLGNMRKGCCSMEECHLLPTYDNAKGSCRNKCHRRRQVVNMMKRN
ncbi:uncharacterized protein LOC144244695 isoform X2 [Crocuta crocuta]